MIEKGWDVDDLERLCQINTLAFPKDERAAPANFRDMLDISEVWVIREKLNNLIVGYIIVNEMVLSDHPYLWVIAVDPEYAGLGYGKFLLREVLQHYDNRDTPLELDVREDNVHAQMFYLYHGFRVVGYRPGHYLIDGMPVAAVRMRRARDSRGISVSAAPTD